MLIKRAGVALLAASGMLLPAHCLAIDISALALNRDPFQSPKASPAPVASSAAAPGEREQAADTWRPRLRAVLYDQHRSLVNIDGQILGLDESLRGYRVSRVGEREVVLVKDGKQIRLEIGRD